MLPQCVFCKLSSLLWLSRVPRLCLHREPSGDLDKIAPEHLQRGCSVLAELWGDFYTCLSSSFCPGWRTNLAEHPCCAVVGVGDGTARSSSDARSWSCPGTEQPALSPPALPEQQGTSRHIHKCPRGFSPAPVQRVPLVPPRNPQRAPVLTLSTSKRGSPALSGGCRGEAN